MRVQRVPSSAVLWAIILVSLAVHVLSLALGNTVLDGWTCEHLPFHSAIEVAGAAIALHVAWLLLTLESRDAGTSRNIFVACALIGMGVLDGVHGMVAPGNAFVWLHSVATLVGGVLFLLVWAPEHWQFAERRVWPKIVFFGALALGIFSASAQQLLPLMLIDGSFTGQATALNMIGGVCMLVAAVRFVQLWLLHRKQDDLLFCLHCTLFGAAAIMFEFSAIWDVPWWGWHILRLLAYSVALWYVMQTDRRLQQIHRELAAIIESTQDAVVAVNLAGVVTSWNRGAEEVFRFSPREIVGRSVDNLIPADRFHERQQVFERLKQGESFIQIETERLRKDGSRVSVSLSISPIKSKSGRIVGVATISRDITDRLRAERQLARRTAQIEMLLDSTAEGIYGIDPEGRCTFANVACARLLGYASPVEFIGRDMHHLIHHGPEDSHCETTQCSAFRAFHEGHHVHVDDQKLWRQNGTSFAAEFWSHPIVDDREIVGSVVTFLDITERKKLANVEHKFQEKLKNLVHRRTDELERQTAELQEKNAALDQLKGYLEGVLQAGLRTAMIAVGKEGTVTLFNSGAERITGYRSVEIVDKTTPMLWHLESEVEARARELEEEGYGPVSGFETFIKKAVVEGYDENEWTFVCKNGTHRRVLLNVTALRSKGEVVGYLGVGVDITERKRNEEALIQATRAAQAASHAKSEFLANMSHEIRTPLNAVIGLTEAVLRSDIEREHREHLETVLNSAESLLSVINDILDFSKIEAGKLDLERIPFHVRSTMQDTLKTLELRAAEKDLKLTHDVHRTVPDILVGDPGRLRQILTNLTSNAIKFTDQGNVALRVTSHRQAHESLLKFEVEDSGVGISPADLERLFAPFEQADSSITRKHGGTGLGLSICRQLVDLMGGRIEAESTPGKGTTFRFEIPFELPDDTVPMTLSAPPSDSGVFAQPSRPLKILLAEDSIPNQKVVKAMLSKTQHQLDIANNGREAVRLYEQANGSYDIIFMDVQMPEMDGFSASAAIRKYEREHQITTPIVAMTAHALQGDRELCLARGMDDYLSKPIRRQELFRMLETFGEPISSTHETNNSHLPEDSDESQLVDWTVALEQVEHDQDLLLAVVESFVYETEGLLECLPTQIEQRDWAEAHRLAHTIKGAMRTFGASQATEIAFKLESSLKEISERGQSEFSSDEQHHVQRLLRSTVEVVEKVLAELQAFLDRKTSGDTA